MPRFTVKKTFGSDEASVTFGEGDGAVTVSAEGLRSMAQRGLAELVGTYTLDGPKEPAYVTETAQMLAVFWPLAYSPEASNEILKKQFQIARAWMRVINQTRKDAGKKPLGFSSYVKGTLKLDDTKRQAFFKQSQPNGFADVIAPWNSTKAIGSVVDMTDTINSMAG